MTDDQWQRRAACRGMTAAFFPERGADQTEAKAVCAECPVIVQCAEAGRYERFGIWAGKSERSRKRGRSGAPPGIRHGTRTRYQDYGCRCELCRNAQVDYQRRSDLRGSPGSPGRTHGCISTYNAGCDCRQCMDASRDARARSRQRAKEAS